MADNEKNTVETTEGVEAVAAEVSAAAEEKAEKPAKKAPAKKAEGEAAEKKPAAKKAPAKKAEGEAAEKKPAAKKPAAKKVEPKADDAAEEVAEGEAKKPAKKAKGKPAPKEHTRLEEKFRKEVIPAMMQKFGYKNVMQVPRMEKIILNMGVGEAKDNPKALEAAVGDLAIITGQKAIVTKARKSVANFKLREGMSIGAKVTLRGDYMYNFMDKFVNVSLPRVRDFRGVSAKSFDGRGNYALGVKDQLIFPEIEYDKVDKVRGMDVIFVTTAKTDEEAKAMLDFMGMPFANA